jgi:hypothetical protein
MFRMGVWRGPRIQFPNPADSSGAVVRHLERTFGAAPEPGGRSWGRTRPGVNRKRVPINRRAGAGEGIAGLRRAQPRTKESWPLAATSRT